MQELDATIINAEEFARRAQEAELKAEQGEVESETDEGVTRETPGAEESAKDVEQEAPADEITEPTDDDQQKDGELPDWMKKRLKRVESKYKRELDSYKQEVDQYIKQVRPQSQEPTYDVNNQVADPFTGAVYDKDSVNGQVILKLQEMAQYQEHAEVSQKQQQELMQLKNKVTQGVEKYDDYEDVLMSSPITEAMVKAAALSDNTADLLYNLAKKRPADAERISKLSPELQFREMVLMEKELLSTPKAVVRNTAPPPSKVAGSGKIETSLENMSFDQRLALARKQLREKHHR